MAASISISVENIERIAICLFLVIINRLFSYSRLYIAVATFKKNLIENEAAYIDITRTRLLGIKNQVNNV